MEDQKTIRISLDVTPGMHKTLKIYSTIQGKSLSQIIVENMTIKEIPEEELWIYDPKNKELVAEIRESLKQSARGETVSWDDIKHEFGL